MTIKRKRIYEIIIIGLVIILTSLCAYMGITAIQKSMKLNLSFTASPVVYCQMKIGEELVFDNLSSQIGDGVENLSGNTLTFNQDKLASTIGVESFSLTLKNYNETGSSILVEFENATISGKTGYSEIIASGNSSTFAVTPLNLVGISMTKVTPVTLSLGAGVTLTSSNLRTATSGAQYLLFGEDLEAEISLGSFYVAPSFVFNGEAITIIDNQFTIPSEDLIGGNTEIDVSAVFQLPYTIKTYNQANTGTTYNSAWDGYSYVEFGEYPQTLVTGISPSLTDEPSYIYGGNIFKIYTDGTNRYATITPEGGVEINQYYKFEPIRWIVIAASTDSDTKGKYGTGSNKTDDVPGTKQLLLLSEFGLYREYFDKEDVTSKFGSSECDIQVSLNNDFADMAGLDDYFENGEGVSAENEFIAEVTPGTTYEDSVRGYFDTISSYNIFLLGCGFDEDIDPLIDPYWCMYYMDEYSEQMQCVPTAFAQTTGVGTWNDACYWWLRTGGYVSIGSQSNLIAYQVNDSGEMGWAPVGSYYNAARPCFVLNLV